MLPSGVVWYYLFSIREELLHRNVQRFRGGLVFKVHRLCVSLNSRLQSNKEEEEDVWYASVKFGEKTTARTHQTLSPGA